MAQVHIEVGCPLALFKDQGMVPSMAARAQKKSLRSSSVLMTVWEVVSLAIPSVIASAMALSARLISPQLVSPFTNAVPWPGTLG